MTSVPGLINSVWILHSERHFPARLVTFNVCECYYWISTNTTIVFVMTNYWSYYWSWLLRSYSPAKNCDLESDRDTTDPSSHWPFPVQPLLSHPIRCRLLFPGQFITSIAPIIHFIYRVQEKTHLISGAKHSDTSYRKLDIQWPPNRLCQEMQLLQNLSPVTTLGLCRILVSGLPFIILIVFPLCPGMWPSMSQMCCRLGI